MDEADKWLASFLRKYPDLDNKVGYDCLHYALSTTTSMVDEDIAEVALKHLEDMFTGELDRVFGKLSYNELTYETVPELIHED